MKARILCPRLATACVAVFALTLGGGAPAVAQTQNGGQLSEVGGSRGNDERQAPPAGVLNIEDLDRPIIITPGPRTETNLPDSEATADPKATSFTTYKVIDVTRTENVAGRATIARCVAVTDGGTCSISAGVSVAVQVGVTLGATIQMVTAGLNVNSTTTVSLNVGCNSPTMTAGQSWEAHPVGTAYTYRIQRWNLFTGTQTSGTLTAFIPDANGIACGIAP